MSFNDATTHLLKQWDLLPLSELLPGDFGCTASGGGGGDPGGGGEQIEVPPPAKIRLAMMDARTRALDEACTLLALSCRRAAEQRGEEASVLAINGGFNPDVLSVLNAAICLHPMTHRVKRELSFEAKLVLARQASCPLPLPTPILPILRALAQSGLSRAARTVSPNPHHPSQL